MTSSRPVTVIEGDAIDALREMKSNSIGAVAVDPPYGMNTLPPSKTNEVLTKWLTGDRLAMPSGAGFMANSWDKFVPPPGLWDEVFRVMKPGAYAAVFAAPRTQHLMGLSLSLAGFQIRDTIMWVNGQGMPKGQDVSRMVEATLTSGKSNSRALRQVEQDGDGAEYTREGRNNGLMGEKRTYTRKEFSAASEEAQKWEGYKTCLKPAVEPILLVQKPVEGNIAKNVMKYGVGALHVDACRSDSGRFPANLVLDEGAASSLGEESDFFPVMKYAAKASKSERPFYFDENGKKIAHPSVKPQSVMDWIVSLIAPEGETVLDMFAGTGTTGISAIKNGNPAILIENYEPYFPLIQQKIEGAMK